MAAFNSSTYTKQVAGQKQVPSMGGHAHKCFVAMAQVAVSSALALNDTIGFFVLPKGAVFQDAKLASSDIDTGSAAITIDVGDATNGAASIFSQSLSGQAGVPDNNPVKTAYGMQYLADTPIFGTIHVAAATAASGTITLIVEYTIEGLPSGT